MRTGPQGASRRRAWCARLLRSAVCLVMLCAHAVAADAFPDMMYGPGEYTVTITDEQRETCERLLADATENVQRNESFWAFARMDQLDERLRAAEDTYRRGVYEQCFADCMPTEQDITAENALFIAYAYLMEAEGISYAQLTHYYPIFFFISTEKTGTMWYMTLVCHDEVFKDTFQFFLYAQDGSMANVKRSAAVG